MGSILYDYLNDCVLFQDYHLENDFSSLSNNDLRNELNKYREFCIKNLENLRKEIPNSPNTVIFSGINRPTTEDLKKTALYVKCHVLDDPIFSMTHEQDQIQTAISKSLGFDSTETINKIQLSNSLKFMKTITPMIAYNYIKFLPISYIHEAPSQLGISYSDNYFKDLLPESIMQFLHKNSRIRSLSKQEQGWIVEDYLKPCRGLLIEFPDCIIGSETAGMIFHLQEMKILNVDIERETFQFNLYLPDNAPSPEYFNTWKTQSLNSASNTLYNQILNEFAISSQCSASYYINSSFVFDLLNLLGNNVPNVESETINAILSLDLPLIENIDLATIMKIRNDDGEAFEAFRDSLETVLLELRTETDKHLLEIKKQNLIHQLNETKIRDIERQIRSLRKVALAETAIGVLGLAGSIFTSGWSLLAAAAAIFQGFKTFSDYQRQVTLNPAFFLWKLKKESNSHTA